VITVELSPGQPYALTETVTIWHTQTTPQTVKIRPDGVIVSPCPITVDGPLTAQEMPRVIRTGEHE
jgi:hypothetical protein